jgi:hypothetical protein
MRAFLIALGGIRVGTIRPLELGTDGLLEVADPPPLPSLGYWSVPCLPRPNITPKRKPKSVSVQVKGCTLKTSCTPPEIKYSMSFDVIGCQEEDEREIFIFWQVAMELLHGIKTDPKDFKIFALQKDLEELRQQVEIGTFKDQVSRWKSSKK